MKISFSKSFILAAGLSTVGTSLAQGTWTGCDPVTDGEIKVTPMVTRSADALDEPIKLALESVAAPGEDVDVGSPHQCARHGAAPGLCPRFGDVAVHLTPGVSGEISRLIKVCKASTISAPITIGSLP